MGTLVGTVTATDLDLPTATTGTQIYSFLNGGTANVVSSDGRYVINQTTGQIKVNAALNRETMSTPVTYTVIARDNAGGAGYNQVQTAVTIGINDVNESNIFPVTYSMNVNENVATGTLVGTVAATDPDSSSVAFGQQRYSFLVGGVSQATSGDGRYTINATTGAITTAVAMNRETMSAPVTYAVIVRDNAGNAPYFQRQSDVTVGVNDLNEANALANHSMNVAENVAVGTTVGTVVATDLDSSAVAFGQQRYYLGSVGSTTSSDGRYTIDTVTGVVKTAVAINYETMSAPTTYTIIARDNLGAGNQVSATLTVGVTNLNEANALGNHSMNVAENVAVGTTVGTVAATDLDSSSVAFGQQRYYLGSVGSTTSSDGRYTIDTVTGAVRTAVAINYETMSTPTTYTIIARDNVGAGNQVNATLTVGVTNVNETPNALTLQSQTLFSETLPGDTSHAGQSIARLNLSDPDGTTPTLQIIGGNANGWFTTSGINLNFAGANFTADWLRAYMGQYGTDATWAYDADGDGLKEVRVATLTLAAVDSGGLQSSPFTYNVFIEDKNEAPAWGANPYTLGVNENSAAYTLVGTVAASDIDGPASELRYTFAQMSAYTNGTLGRQVTSSQDGRFVMDLLDGRVWVNGSQALNYESLPSFSYATVVFDKALGANNKGTNGTLNINLANVNDIAPAAPAVSTWGTTTFNENAGAGVTVATLAAANDGDGGLNAASFQLTANPDGLFEIVGQTLRMRTDRTANYETFASGGASTTIQVRVRTTDGTYVSGETAINVQINNLNEFPTTYTQIPSTFTVTENTGLGTIVSDGVRATDADGLAITYSLDQSTNPNGAFGINSAGQITIAAGVDYEAGNWLSDAQGKYANLRILASDGGAAAATIVQIRIANQVLQVMTPGGSLTSRYHWEHSSTQTEFEMWGQWYTEDKWVDNVTGAVVMRDGDWGPSEGTTMRPVPHKDYATLAEGFRWSGNGWELISDDEFNSNSAWPIVFDLTGQGIENAFGTHKVSFDLDGGGAAETVQWLNSGFGFLALDRNGDGIISSALEIAFTQDKAGAKTDLEGLTAYDINGDGQFSAADARFGEFRIWQDSNNDGVSGAGELKSLAELGIVSIGLTPTPTGQTFANTQGNVMLNTATFTFADGSEGAIGDVVLRPALGSDVVTLPPSGDDGSAASAPETPPAPQVSFVTRDFAGRDRKYALSVEGGSLFVRDVRSDDTVDARVGLTGPAALLNFRGRQVGMLAPIVFDLDGDGVELKKRTDSKARFDMDGNGSRDDTGWISKQDGFLVIDSNGNGRVDSAAELSLLGLKADAKNSFEALATLDSDRNGVLDSKDARFSELKVWVDRNGNGVTDSGELASLAESGIASIDLAARAAPNSTAKIGRNAMLATSTFTRTDGSKGSAGDAALAFRPGAAAPAASALQSDALPSDLRSQLQSLRAGLNSGSGWMGRSLNIPAGVDPFELYQPKPEVLKPAVASAQPEVLKPAAGSAAAEGFSQRTQDLPRVAVVLSDESDLPTAIVEEKGAGGLAQETRVAQMIQDMASFGTKSGESDWRDRSHGSNTRYDYFTA